MRVRCPSCELVVDVLEGKTRLKCPNCGFKADIPPQGARVDLAPPPVASVSRRPRTLPDPPVPAPMPPSMMAPIAPGPSPGRRIRMRGKIGVIALSVVAVVIGGILLLGLLGSTVRQQESDTAQQQAIESYMSSSEATFTDNPEWSDNVAIIITIYEAQADGTSLVEDPIYALDATSEGGSIVSRRLTALAAPAPAQKYAYALVDLVDSTVRAANYWSAAYQETDLESQGYLVGLAQDEVDGLCGRATDLSDGIKELERWYEDHDVPLEDSLVAQVKLDVEDLQSSICGF